jgi:CAAX protease family protein
LLTECASSADENRGATLAPRWHTAALVGLLLAVALTGTLLQRYGAHSSALAAPARAESRIFAQYLPLLVVNWGLVLYTCWLFRGRNVLPDLLGRRWSNVGRAATDLGLGLGGVLVVMSVELVCARLFPVGRNAAIAALLPSTGAERLTWAFVALNVGFCEEVVYRGYLQTQLAAFTRSRALGVVMQAALFGVAHLEQGPATALRIALYGLLLGALAQLRQSLLPGIVCHVALDLAPVFLR